MIDNIEREIPVASNYMCTSTDRQSLLCSLAVCFMLFSVFSLSHSNQSLLCLLRCLYGARDDEVEKEEEKAVAVDANEVYLS